MEADGIVDPLRRRTLIKANLRGGIAPQLILEKGMYRYVHESVKSTTCTEADLPATDKETSQ